MSDKQEPKINKEDQNKRQQGSKQQSQWSSEVPKIMSKSEQINYLILHKGFLKVKVTSHISVPLNKNINKEIKSRMLLVPSTYNVYKIKEQIKKTFNINDKQAIFLFMKSEKIVDSALTIKQLHDRYTGAGTAGVGCLELSVYSSQFSGNSY